MKYSTNTKLNNVLTDIENQLRTMLDTEQESLDTIKAYMKEYPKELDYNIVQSGSLLAYYEDVRNMYRKAGYKVENYSDTQIWDSYQRQVGMVAREITKS